MFVRFRQSGHRLQTSLIENPRVDGKVRHEHIASLGSITLPPSVAERITFWQRLHGRLAKLSNRVTTEDQGKVLGAVHAKAWRMRGLRRAEVQPVAPQVIGIIASHHVGHLLPCRRAGALSTATCWQPPLMGFAHIGERCRRKRIFEKPARSDQEERREGDRFFTRPGIEIFEELYEQNAPSVHKADNSDSFF
jgi:hypothetical protein